MKKYIKSSKDHREQILTEFLSEEVTLNDALFDVYNAINDAIIPCENVVAKDSRIQQVNTILRTLREMKQEFYTIYTDYHDDLSEVHQMYLNGSFED